MGIGYETIQNQVEMKTHIFTTLVYMTLHQSIGKINNYGIAFFLLIVLTWTSVSAQGQMPFGEWTVVSGDFHSGPEAWYTLRLASSKPELDGNSSIWKTIRITKNELVWTVGSTSDNPEKKEVLSGEQSVGVKIRIKKRKDRCVIRVLDSFATRLEMVPNDNGWMIFRKPNH